MSVLFIFILALMQCKICNWFLLFSRDPDGRSTDLSVYVYGGLHNVLIRGVSWPSG